MVAGLEQVERGVPEVDLRAGQEGLRIEDLGRDGEPLPVPVVLDPQVLLRPIDGDPAIGRGPATATVSMTAGVLLGLLLGTRDFDEELRGGRARVAPRTADALRSARAAFPPRRFWIADAW